MAKATAGTWGSSDYIQATPKKYKVMVPRYSAFQKCEEIYQDFQAQKKDYCPKCHAPL